MPVMFKGVGSGDEPPTAPDRAAKEEKILVIGAPHSRQAVKLASVMRCRYSLRRAQGG